MQLIHLGVALWHPRLSSLGSSNIFRQYNNFYLELMPKKMIIFIVPFNSGLLKFTRQLSEQGDIKEWSLYEMNKNLHE